MPRLRIWPISWSRLKGAAMKQVQIRKSDIRKPSPKPEPDTSTPGGRKLPW
jgi:hypothetical protein